MKTNLKIIVLIIAIFCNLNSFAQVGIGTVNVRESAMLEIVSTNRGLLIPRVVDVGKVKKDSTGAIATATLVFDEDLNKFMYWDGGDWLSLTAFESTGKETSDVKIFSEEDATGRVVIGEKPVDSLFTEKLQVIGNVKVAGNIEATNITAKNGNITAKNGKFIGFGTVPIGGIIMWSGDDKYFNDTGKGLGEMEGWALCNGKTYNTSVTSGASGATGTGGTGGSGGGGEIGNDGEIGEGGGRPKKVGYYGASLIITPDLRGRFIVGYGGAGDYSEIGNKGGSEKVTLTAAESGLPAHSHLINDQGHSHTYNNWPLTGSSKKAHHNSASAVSMNGTETEVISGITKTGITIIDNKAEPADLSHENRPPYYVLAYIIRVK